MEKKKRKEKSFVFLKKCLIEMKAVLKNNQRLKKNDIYKTKQYVKPAAAYSIGFI